MKHETIGLERLNRHLPIIVGLIIIAALEVFVFNLPFWQTINATPTIAQTENLGNGLKKTSDNQATITNPESAWRSISSNQVISYYYIVPTEQEKDIAPVTWTISTQKETDSNWYKATKTGGYSPRVDASRYGHIGNLTTKIKFEYSGPKGTAIPLSDIIINPHVPFRVSPTRLALELLILVTLLLFWPSSFIYRTMFSDKSRLSIVSVGLLLAVEIAATCWLWMQSDGMHIKGGIGLTGTGTYFDADQYAHLADSIIHGRAHLDFPVNEQLKSMDNPYDAQKRFEIARNTDTPILLDVAFKDGRYYSYFGVIPALLTFVPYRLIMGHDLAAAKGNLIWGVLVVIAATVLCIQIARLLTANNKRVSLGSVLLGALCMYLGTGVAQNIQFMLFYTIPQFSGLFFTLLAFIFWIEAKNHDLNPLWMAAGAFSFAMILGCRPQFGLSLIIVVVFFWKDIVKLWQDGLISSGGMRREILVWLSVIIPAIIVVLPLLWYNSIRFGSPLDFGANYNLTGYDMTHHKLPLSLLFPLSFLYLFQPLNISTAFPFIQQTLSPMPIWLPMQPSYGGYFAFFAPFASVLLIPGLWRKRAKKMGGLLVIYCLIAYAVIVLIFNAHIVGYDIRYNLDFIWALSAAFVIILYSLSFIDNQINTEAIVSNNREVLNHKSNPLIKYTIGFIAIFTALSILILFFMHFLWGNVTETAWWSTNSWFTLI